jgi:SARP family transcriptional regulator, regulator of embCAB operon
MRVEIKVLGSLKASVADMSFVPTASKPRQMLAMLALNAGNIVTVSAIMEELWGKTLPRSVTTTLHTYISHLRRKLDLTLASWQCSSKEILVTEHTGYMLDVDPADVDARRYEELSAAGRRAADDGDYATAAQTLRSALSLWRGPALADVTTGSQLEIDVLRLEESRLSDLEMRIDADLRLCRHQHVLGELAVLCAQHPMLESFHAQYMLALYRSARQWRALEVYQQLRATMVNELGVDPSPRLRQLHQSILTGDPVLDDPAFAGSEWRPAAFAG